MGRVILLLLLAIPVAAWADDLPFCDEYKDRLDIHLRACDPVNIGVIDASGGNGRGRGPGPDDGPGVGFDPNPHPG